MGAKSLFFALALLLPAAPAAADVIELTFTGYVQTTPTDGIVFFQPGGPPQPYAGDNAPVYPVQAGDSVTVTFSGNVPISSGQPPPPGGVDGIYRFPVRGLNSPGGSSSFNLFEIEVEGLGHARGSGGQEFGAGGFNIVYDSGSGQYFIDLGSDGTFGFGYVDLPSYEYDPIADIFTPSRNCGNDPSSCPSTGAEGTIGTLSFADIRIYSPEGDPIGRLGPLTLVGGFNLPAWTAPAPVPAPPALPLFAAALALLGWRFGWGRTA